MSASLSEFLPAARTLGIQRHSTCGGRVMRDGNLAAFVDLAPVEESFEEAVLAGLSRAEKAIHCRFLYDRRGSALFEAICELPEYYVTRTEMGILRARAGAI